MMSDNLQRDISSLNVRTVQSQKRKQSFNEDNGEDFSSSLPSYSDDEDDDFTPNVEEEEEEEDLNSQRCDSSSPELKIIPIDNEDVTGGRRKNIVDSVKRPQIYSPITPRSETYRPLPHSITKMCDINKKN